MDTQSAVGQIRAFNRFYTRQLGLLNERPYGDQSTLTEVRVLFELAQRDSLKPGDLVTQLGLDPAYVSRILKDFEGKGLIRRERDPDDGRGVRIRLTPSGQAAFAPLDAASATSIGAMIAHLAPGQAGELGGAMQTIRRLLQPDPETDIGTGPETNEGTRVTLRGLKIGDIGHIIRRQGELYAAEYGMDITYEALVAELLSSFVTTFDPALEDAIIAERDGEVVGSVFLFRGDSGDNTQKTGKLRLLYVDPAARGLGLGAQLVDGCIAAARVRGYSRLKLWTQDCLISARRIYQAAGFELVSEERHRSFGQDFNGQIWQLDL